MTNVVIETARRRVKISRHAHTLKPNSKNELPSHIIFYDTETTEKKIEMGLSKHEFKLVCAEYYRRRGTQYVREKSITTFSLSAFWEWVFTCKLEKTSLWLVSHNQHFDFNIINAFNVMQKNNYKIEKCIIDTTRFWVKFAKKGHSIIFQDNTNYFKVPLRELGKLFGVQKLDIDPLKEKDMEKLVEYCQRDVAILAKAFLSWISFVRENNLGNFASTLAGQAFNAFRHKYMKVPIFIHDNTLAIRLELDSYRGGISDIFRRGHIHTHVTKLDVNSMYPAVMKNNVFPVKLLNTAEDLETEKLFKIPHETVWIADCDIEIFHPVLGIPHEKKLCLVTGRVRATITSAEYNAFKRYLKIHHIHAIAFYEAANIFSDYVSDLYAVRQQFKIEGNDVFAYCTKILLNSLYGKFGQTTRERELIHQSKFRDDMLPVRYEDENCIVQKEVQRLGKYVLIEKEHKISFQAFPAIASFVTAYARIRLMQLILKAGEENVFYVDTDSLFVSDVGLERLREEIDEKELGKLKVEAKADGCFIFAPKDYIFADKITLKGIKNGARKIGNEEYVQTKFRKTLAMWKQGVFDSVLTEEQRIEISHKYTKARVNVDGTISRFHLKQF